MLLLFRIFVTSKVYKVLHDLLRKEKKYSAPNTQIMSEGDFFLPISLMGGSVTMNKPVRINIVI